ncbi:hypothetical protein WJX82_009204 [Trebouxia sp. C0006]
MRRPRAICTKCDAYLHGLFSGVSSYYAQFQAFLAHTTLPSIPVPRNTLLLVRCCHSHGTEGASCQANVVAKCYGCQAPRQAVNPQAARPDKPASRSLIVGQLETAVNMLSSEALQDTVNQILTVDWLALVSENAALTKMGLKQSKRTLVAELQPQKERTASAERRSAEWRATDTSELEAALRAARTETGLQQQLAEAQSIQKVSSAQASSTSWEQAGASTSEDAAPSATSWRPWTIVSLLRQRLLDREEYYRHGIQLSKECLDAMIVKEDIPALERQLEVKNQQLTHCQARSKTSWSYGIQTRISRS